MATAQADAEQRRRQAAALAAGGGQANLAGAQLGAKAAVAPPAAAVRATAASAIIAGLVTFLAALRTRHREWLTRELAKRRPQAQPAVPQDIAAVLAEEDRREVAFAQASAARVASGLPSALAIGDPAERQAAIRGLLAKERNYARQRGQAMAERAFAALDRTALRRVSPAGAYWELNPRLDHCPQCVAMANRFWPWAVLDVIHPPVHLHCGCTLSSYLDAVARGVMRPSDVRPLGEAIELAAAVDALSDEQAAALLNEVALREALVAQGLASPAQLDAVPLIGVAEAFEEHEHPRGWHGRFVRAAAAALALRRRREPGMGTMRTRTTTPIEGQTGLRDALAVQAREVRAKTPALYDEWTRMRLRKLLGPDAHVAVRVPSEALPTILRRGRVVNAFDPRHAQHDRSASDKYLQSRGEMESRVFELPDVPTPADRPIYGYIATNEEHLGNSAVGAFGDAKLVLRPAVRDRTTFVYSDSMYAGAKDGNLLPAPVNDPHELAVSHFQNLGGVEHLTPVRSITEPRPLPPLTPQEERDRERAFDKGWWDTLRRQRVEEAGYRPWPWGDFFEAQVHGGLKLSDIERVDFSAEPSAELKTALAKAGLAYTVGGPPAKGPR